MMIKANVPIILASQSPRREELLSKLNIPFTIQVSGVDEEIAGKATPEALALIIAKKKGEHVANEHPESIVIAADTTVFLDDYLLSKPKNEHQAKEYLRRLSGKTHRVITGVSIKGMGSDVGFSETTYVTFHELTDELIDAYVATGDPLDKAGAYGIQSMGGLLVQRIEGDYNNVVGLPLSRLFHILLDMRVIELDGEGMR